MSFVVFSLLIFCFHRSGKGDCSERCTGVFLPCHLLFSACLYSAFIVRGKGTARSAAPVFFCRVVCCSRFVSVLPVSFGERGFYERMYSKCPHCLSFGDAVLRGIGNYGRAGSVLFRFWTGGCGIIPAYPEAVASVPYFCTVIFFLSVPAEKSGAGKDDSRFRSQGSRCDRCKVGRIPEAGAADVLKSKRGTNRGD